jgi:probable F420-dependent oxidoreductase
MVKIRIGISAGGQDLAPEEMATLGRAISDRGFDSLWLPEVLSRPGPDPLVGLAWASGACPGLKIGTTMLLPGRNLVWLAKAVATLDLLSGGRFLLTFVPGLSIGGEGQAVGIPTAERGNLMDEALPVLRRLWSGEAVSHEGRAGTFSEVTVSPRPVQDPFDVWLGGNAPKALERCGRLGDGWIPAFCTPEDAAAGKRVIDQVAAEHHRAISPEHFGISLAYAPPGTDLQATPVSALARRARGRPLEEIIPIGLDGLRNLIESFLAVGFSKFIVRPLTPPGGWPGELDSLADAVGGLQT